MMYSFFYVALLSACVLFSVANAAAQNNTDDVNAEGGVSAPLPAYELPGTQTFSINSLATGHDYNIVVSLPGSYASAPEGKVYPVLYVLDAQWQFPLIYTATGAVIHDGDMPEAIVVGISWRETNGNLMALRNVDLTPTTSAGDPTSGHADKFQNFLRKELFPHIESTFKASKDRTVTGGSTSALFVFYTLISQPDLFRGYIASSPSIYWDKQVMFKLLKDFSPDIIPQGTRAYLAWGSLENATEIQLFAEQLAAKKAKNLAFRFAEVSNAGHAAVNPECYVRGFQFVYAKPSLRLPSTYLKSLTGTYKSTVHEFAIKVTFADGKLRVQYPEGDSYSLEAAAEREFYARGNGLAFYFIFDAQHKLQGLEQVAHGDTIALVKIQ